MVEVGAKGQSHKIRQIQIVEDSAARVVSARPSAEAHRDAVARAGRWPGFYGRNLERLTECRSRDQCGAQYNPQSQALLDSPKDTTKIS